jgi:hypothetical protein
VATIRDCLSSVKPLERAATHAHHPVIPKIFSTFTSTTCI